MVGHQLVFPVVPARTGIDIERTQGLKDCVSPVHSYMLFLRLVTSTTDMLVTLSDDHLHLSNLVLT